MTTRNDYINDLVNEIAPKVWLSISGNGSLRINIDTDVQCYGEWEPYGPSGAGTDTTDEVQYAQSWVQLFVRSTVNRLVEKDLLNVPEDK